MIIRNDRQAILTGDFFKGHSYEVAVVAVGLDGTKQAMEIAPKNAITIKGKEDAPTPASGLTAAGFYGAIVLTWTNPLDYDFDHMEVWRSWAGNIAYAVKVAEVKGISYTDPISPMGVTRWYWIRAINTSGVASDYYPDDTVGVSATTLGVTATDIDNFAITATKLFTKTIILTGDAWTNNSPTAGKAAWNAHNIVYNGVSYPISAGNTALAYVYWTIGDPAYTASATHPTLGNTAFMIAINTAGVHTLVWNSSANMVIGTAFIANLAVTNAKINDINAAKITAGSINASIIDVYNLTASNINTGTLTAIKVQTDTGAVGHYKRAVLDNSDNTLRFYNSSDKNVVTIDDTVSGFVGVGDITTNEQVWLKSASIGFWTATDNLVVLEVNKWNAGVGAWDTGKCWIDAEGDARFCAGMGGFPINLSAGNITLIDTKTVDGVDVSAHAADVNAHHAQYHNLIDTTGHPASGLTSGHFLKATGTAAYGFAVHGLTYSSVGAEQANSNIQTHVTGTGSPHTAAGVGAAAASHAHAATDITSAQFDTARLPNAIVVSSTIKGSGFIVGATAGISGSFTTATRLIQYAGGIIWSNTLLE